MPAILVLVWGWYNMVEFWFWGGLLSVTVFVILCWGKFVRMWCICWFRVALILDVWWFAVVFGFVVLMFDFGLLRDLFCLDIWIGLYAWVTCCFGGV